jgi:rubredoxin
MSSGSKVKRFSCVKCGTAFEANPPDDVHNMAKRVMEECGHSVRVDYKCEMCGNINTIFWCHVQ